MNEMAVWLDPALPFSVDYSCAALERVRQRAADGLIALPRVGMGVGGLLLGEHIPTGIRITGAIELPCSHSLGPTFQLTPEEIRQSVLVLKNAGSHRGVVGLYCTRTRGDVVLGGPERELFDLLCPEPWQVAFVVRPAPGEVAKAAFFFRDKTGLKAGSAQDLWDWRPPDLEKTQREVAARLDAISKALADPPAPVAPTPAPVEEAHVSPALANPEPFAPSPVIEMPRPAQPPQARPLPRTASAPITAGLFAQLEEEPDASAEEPRPNLLADPRFAPGVPVTRTGVPFAGDPLPGLPPVPQRRRPSVLLMWVAVILILGLAGGAFVTRDTWLPRPPLTMSSSDTNGTMEIHWNAEAARGIDRAELLINDGGQLNTVTLDSLKLLAGLYIYKRKSDRVTVTLDLGAARGRTGYQPEPMGAVPDPSAPPPSAAPNPGLLPTGDSTAPSYAAPPTAAPATPATAAAAATPPAPPAAPPAKAKKKSAR